MFENILVVFFNSPLPLLGNAQKYQQEIDKSRWEKEKAPTSLI
jgi:hypothetical protein